MLVLPSRGLSQQKVSAAQVSRELSLEENGIFLMVVQTCFNHRNEHKIQLVPSAIVWNSFSLQPPAAGGFNVTFF